MTTVNGSRIGRLEATIKAEMQQWHVPGLTIGILDGDAVEVAGFGIANVETGVPVTPETLFQIGSISKIFTTTLIMTLVEEGKLDLDTTVITYVPTLPLADENARNSITIRHLLTHMAGFYGDRFDDQGRGDDALAKAVAAFGDLPQQTAPGDVYTYCNAGFDLAGRAAELVTGQGFEALMRERVFGPLGMERATYFSDEAILHAVAVGHAKGDDDTKLKVSTPWPIPRRSNPAGGVSTNVAALLRFARMHLQGGELDGKRVLSSASARQMQAKHIDSEAYKTRGLGWSRNEIGGELIIEHNGATNGFAARLTTVPAKGFAIAIFTNHNDGGAAHTKICEAALERLLGLVSPPLEIVKRSDSDLARFAGTYTHGLGDLTLTVENGGYNVTRVHRNPFSGEETPGDPFTLRPVGERIFRAEGGVLDGNLAEILLDRSGSVRFMRFGGRLAYPVAKS